MKVKLNNLKITDVEGNYGPQKKVNFKQILPEGSRWISGFLKPFEVDNTWVEGAEKDLDIYQKGDFWNFKIGIGRSGNQSKQLSGASVEQHEAVMDALRKLYVKIEEVHKQVMKDKEPGIFDE